jgi:hypothetical protein
LILSGARFISVIARLDQAIQEEETVFSVNLEKDVKKATLH